MAVVVVLSVVWAVNRTIVRARTSTQWIAHTQQVLMTIETLAGTMADAESATRNYLSSADPRLLEPLDRAERTVDADLERLAALTDDNPTQHARQAQLRDRAAQALTAFRARANAKRTGVDAGETGVDRLQTSMDAVRSAMRAMRNEENRLLAERVEAEQGAASYLQWISIVLMIAAVGLLGGAIWLGARRQRRRSEALSRANQELETQVGAGAADLRDANARLQSIIDSAVDGIIVIDTRGTIESFNPGAERLFGYPASEVIGRNVSLLMPSPDHERHDGYLKSYLETGAKTIIGGGRQVNGRRRDGTIFPLHLSVGEMSIQGERKFTGMLHDLSERMRLDAELRASESRWRSIVDSAVDAIVVIDAHGRIEAFNPAAERLFGYGEREVIGRNVNLLMPSPYHEEHDTYLARHLATGVQKIIGTGREVTGLRRDGTTFPLHLSVGKMMVDGERKFTGILHDLTARVQIEEQLREQSSLARLGEMAAVIAHEVKNPLAGVRGAVQVIGSRLPKGSKDAAMIQEIVTRIDALNGLMQDMLLFARPPHPKPAPTDVAALVTSTAELMAGDPALKDIHVAIDGAFPRIMADAELLKIVFVNLLVNAAHAMQGRGTIRVSCTAMPDVCRISVADEGPGIPADVLDKIFVPFFTTKSRGSGLGLPTAKRLIEAHHGNIQIACPPAGGTIVTVQLPSEGAAAAM